MPIKLSFFSFLLSLGIYAHAFSVGVAVFHSEDSARNHSHFLCTTWVLVALACYFISFDYFLDLYEYNLSVSLHFVSLGL